MFLNLTFLNYPKNFNLLNWTWVDLLAARIILLAHTIYGPFKQQLAYQLWRCFCLNNTFCWNSINLVALLSCFQTTRASFQKKKKNHLAGLRVGALQWGAQHRTAHFRAVGCTIWWFGGAQHGAAHTIAQHHPHFHLAIWALLFCLYSIFFIIYIC